MKPPITLPTLTIVLGLLVAACGTDRAPTGGAARPPAGTATAADGHADAHGGAHGDATAGQSYDRMFIAGMTPHHDGAIEMAEVALERAEHPEIRELARNIIASQRAENRAMEGWYRAWYGGAVPEVRAMDHAMPGMEMEGAMGVSAEELRRAEPFDRAFIDAMIPHHEAAVTMARDAEERAEHPELRRLARAIVEAQEREVRRMEGWRATWYGS